MTLTYVDVGEWFGFTPGADLYPTAADCTAWLAAAQEDFEALTGGDVVFDETKGSHLMILQSAVERRVKVWFKVRGLMGESFSSTGGSVSHGYTPLFMDKDTIRELAVAIKWSKA
jgi:hypothetical protein